ncbi:MAG: valyl-tRNA synthetase [Thermoplasmata archaeon]|jgi:valyl-tRNA synthetase|nr:valyl-tRNA synthetase [Thermoplasmata archaeon]
MPDEDEAPQSDPAIQAMEEKWLAFWEEQGVYRFDPRSAKPVFSIDTPPPTVSGRMHIGHAYSYNQMDFTARYQRMRGHNLFYPFGFDDNGLPTERYTEKAVGKKLSDVGRQEFIRLCLAETKKGEAEMERSWRRIGTSCDWSLVYRTIDKPVQKVSQESFLALLHDGRVYRAERPTIWCPDCATAIAQAEIEDRMLPSTFNDISFDLMDDHGHGMARAGHEHLVKRTMVPGPEANSKPREVVTYQQGAESKIVISTTRPELIPACVAIFVHPDDERTRHLIGKNVRVPIGGHIVPILTSDKVDKETGTGVVMNCTFGDQVDIEWWQANKLPLRVVVGPKGTMTDAAGKYAGQSIPHAREHVLQDLNREGRLLAQKHIEHAVGVHERCGTPIEFLVTKQWFVKYLDTRGDFLADGEKVAWHPPYMKTRYDNWVKGLKWDWCISRQRYFGVPFPVWYCESCHEPRTAGVDELPVDPTVDKPKGACAKCGGMAFRGETDVMDTWATSSLTPQIAILAAAERMGVPNARLADINTNPRLAAMLPMDVRPQAHEIISFWAFNTIVKARFHHGKIPWKHAQISGFVKLGKGKKMSKSKGDIVEPLDVIRDYSGDALRYWSATGANLGEDIIWNPKELTRAMRLVTKLRNLEGFIAKGLGTEKPAAVPWEKLPLVDQWVLAEFAEVVRSATEGWNGYDYTKAVKETEHFLWHTLADHYVELAKHRLYAGDPAARHTLYTVGLGVLKMMAPVLCFATEDLYQEIYRKHEGDVSIHVSPWPHAPRVDKEALELGGHVRDVVAAIRNWKSQSKMALNQELPAVEVVAPPLVRDALARGKNDIMGTTKVADVRFADAKDIQMVPYAVEPVHAKIGPRYRQNAKAVGDAIRALDPAKVEPQNVVVHLADGTSVRLQPDEIEIKSRPTLHGAAVEALEVGPVTLLLRKA